MNRPQLFARLILAGISLLVLTLALSFAGCRAARTAPDMRASTAQTAPAARPDSLVAKNKRNEIETEKNPGILSGIGQVFSTPESSARRQARKDARAAVPRSIGKGAVYAPAALQVANSYKASAPVTVADTGAVVSNAAAGSQQLNVQGDGNTLTADKQDTTQEAPGVGATIAAKLGGPLGWLLAIAAAAAAGYLLYLIWAFLPRRNTDNQA